MIYIKKNTIIIFSILFFLVATVYMPIIEGDKNSLVLTNMNDTIYVDDDGGADFRFIQNAIDAADAGDTIHVYPGMYEETLLIDKSIYLIGTNANETIICGNTSNESVITITNQGYCEISRFWIQNKVMNGPGIILRSDHNNITGNIVSDCTFGVYAIEAKYNVVCDNTLMQNSEFGLLFMHYTNDNTVIDNVFLNNSFGLRVQSSCCNLIANNLFQYNNKGMYFCCGAYDNQVHHNTFLNNKEWHAIDYMTENIWYDQARKKGNYWDDYIGLDRNEDGIGDTPYSIQGDGNNEDLYPLMLPEHRIAPTDPLLNGPTSGRAGRQHSYTVLSCDENEDEVYYLVEWGDGTNTGWQGPFVQGIEQCFNHTWDDQDEFMVRVQCKDDEGLLSDWTELPVTMPKKHGFHPLFWMLEYLLHKNDSIGSWFTHFQS